MLKKVVSKALLSVVMDKKARRTLEAAKERQETHAGPGAPRPESPEELRLAARAALDQAEKDLTGRPKLTADRKALIRQALEVRRQESERLKENLSPDQQIKLEAMAMEAFGLDPNKGNR